MFAYPERRAIIPRHLNAAIATRRSRPQVSSVRDSDRIIGLLDIRAERRRKRRDHRRASVRGGLLAAEYGSRARALRAGT
jgi:septum formation inhibitor-activating ATPase MinD